MRYDLVDSGLYICSPRLLAYFVENFDFHEMREEFLVDFLTSLVVSDTIHPFVLSEETYVGRIVDFRTYGRVCLDIIKRWVHPYGISKNRKMLFTSTP